MCEIVSFGIAQKLKEKGYPQEPKNRCQYYEWDGLRNIHPLYTEMVWDESENKKYLYSAPTISQVLKWLRETHNLFIVVFLNDDSDNPVTFEIYKGVECVTDYHIKYYPLDKWSKAEIDAIKYVLDNLI